MTGPKCLRCLSICQPEAGLFLQVAGIWGGSSAWLYRTEPSGFTPCDPVVKYGDISISVGDATCQQKADWKMKRTEMERLSDSLKFIRLTEGGRTPMRGVHLWGFRSGVNLLSPFFLSVPSCLPVCLSCCLPVSARIGWSASPSLYVCQSVRLSVCCPDLSPSVSDFAAMPPTPQPTDDVDIYFETPADDKEHSRFQRAKEQLEIRHRNRMERVSLPARIRTLIPERQYVRIFPLSRTVWPHCTWSQMLWRDLFQ